MQTKRIIFLPVIFFGFFAVNGAETELTVRIKNGNVKGRSLVSYDGKPFRSFQAIPFGKSTEGSRRFKAPEPVDNWEGTFDATEFGEECPQFNMVTRGVEGSEDCLILNVYTSWKKGEALLPVMVFIHGGGFTMGTGTYPMYPPEKLMDYNVILVTFNYRVGILGFLNTGDEQSYGNFGMLDQVLALKWVQDNIEKFGGNRDKVIIFGESAGSTSVTYHLISPLSKGLFHGAIAQSGALVSNWTVAQDTMMGARKVADKVNCPISNTRDLVKCFKEKSMIDLIYGDRQTKLTTFYPHYWSPSIEVAGGPGFLRDHPINILRNKQIANPVPYIAGVLTHEGYLFHKEFLSLFSERGVKRLDELPKVLAIVMKEPAKYKQVFSAIREHYFNSPNIADNEVFNQAAIQLLTDMSFKAGVAKTLDYLSEAGVPVYSYVISHVSQHSLAQMFNLPAGKYPSHGDELFLQFPFIFTQFLRMNEDDTKMAFIINTIWSTFAKTLNPSAVIDGIPLKWEKHTKNDPKYLELKLNPEMRKGTVSNETVFWTETLPKLVQLSPKTNDEL